MIRYVRLLGTILYGASYDIGENTTVTGTSALRVHALNESARKHCPHSHLPFPVRFSVQSVSGFDEASDCSLFMLATFR
jgi:hypothetical protein